ncbi:hypothetical protein DZF79_05180 [Vibrio parahaemolyticus]|nr:hypothetical protein [Vibrio parahaemolyticus]
MLEKINLDVVVFGLIFISFVVSIFAVRSIIIRKTALVVLHEGLPEKIPRWGFVSFASVVGLMGVLYRLNAMAFYNTAELLAFMLAFTFIYYVVKLFLNVEEIEKQHSDVIKSAIVLMLLAAPLFAFSAMSSLTLCGCFPPEMCSC